MPNGPPRATVGLAMIVRNESATLPRLAATLAGQIDRWTLVDTGSTDGTVQVAREVFAYAPGNIIEDQWRGFGPSRNVAFEAAEPHTDWLLTLDADDTFHGEIASGELDDVDVVHAEYRFANLHYWVPRLVRSGQGWRWHGRAHEYLAAPDGPGRARRSHAFWVEHHADGGSRADKFEREVRLLLEDWAERPGDPRTAFYLGRSYDDVGTDDEAIAWYRRRLALGGWEEETFYARFRMGACLIRAGHGAEGCGELWRAWGERHWRGLSHWPCWPSTTASKGCGSWPGRPVSSPSPTPAPSRTEASSAPWMLSSSTRPPSSGGWPMKRPLPPGTWARSSGAGAWSATSSPGPTSLTRCGKRWSRTGASTNPAVELGTLADENYR